MNNTSAVKIYTPIAGRRNSGFRRHSARPGDIERADNIGLRAPSAADPQAFHCGSAARVFRSTTVARLMYAASSWCGLTKEVIFLTKASDRQRINSVIDRARRRHGYCSPDLPTFATLQTMNFPLKLPDCRTMSCMHYYHNHITTL